MFKPVEHWQRMFGSYAVWFPVLGSIVLYALQVLLGTDLIPDAYYPAVVAVTGFLGRIIPQPNLYGGLNRDP